MLQAVKSGRGWLPPLGYGAVAGIRRLSVRLDDESDIVACAVIIASGVRYRRLDVPGLADLEGRGVYYAASELEAKRVSGRNAVVAGANGGQAAGSWHGTPTGSTS